ncbi:MAG: BCCT family transporter [Proteobacteria bacterium]|nr:BCCT family transporter [Pseudomonadota bacterium]
MAFNRYGNVRLGDCDGGVEFSQRSWAAMCFCVGVGAGLMYCRA